MRLNYITLFFLLLGTFEAQEKIGIEDLRREYESFNYKEVILVAQELLRDTTALSTEEITEIYLLKAIAHYSLNEEDQVRESFIEILKKDLEYSIDPAKISPKIIRIFDQVKNDYLLAVEQKEKKLEPLVRDTVIIYKNPDTLFVYEQGLRNAMLRSLILPGWGHLYSGIETKGYILTGLAAVTLSSMVYFIVDADKKENDYLSETDVNLIEKKYSDFNRSYKIRNGLIIAYAVVWIYSQLDLLLFNKRTAIPSNLSYQLTSPGFSEFRLSLKYNF